MKASNEPSQCAIDLPKKEKRMVEKSIPDNLSPNGMNTEGQMVRVFNDMQ